MKYTVIGDIHATLKDQEKVNHLFDIIEDMGNPTILLGDLLDNKAIIRAECLNLYYKRLKESKLNFIILVGNHDLISLESSEHSLETLKELKNVKIVDTPMVIDGMYFVPYIHDLVKCREALQYVDSSVKALIGEMPVLFIHQGVIGYDYGNGYIAEEGISKQEITRFGRIIAGHFHKFQQDGDLTFLGTSFSKSFGESDQIKYIATYDSNTDKLELIKTDFPQHKTIEIELGAVCKVDGDLILEENGIYRIILKGSQVLIDNYPRQPYPDVKFVERPTDDFETSVSIDESVDCVQQFETWGRDIKQIDEETLKIGAEILRSCK